jgi:hypothetical protein
VIQGLVSNLEPTASSWLTFAEEDKLPFLNQVLQSVGPGRTVACGTAYHVHHDRILVRLGLFAQFLLLANCN